MWLTVRPVTSRVDVLFICWISKMNMRNLGNVPSGVPGLDRDATETQRWLAETSWLCQNQIQQSFQTAWLRTKRRRDLVECASFHTVTSWCFCPTTGLSAVGRGHDLLCQSLSPSQSSKWATLCSSLLLHRTLLCMHARSLWHCMISLMHKGWAHLDRRTFSTAITAACVHVAVNDWMCFFVTY